MPRHLAQVGGGEDADAADTCTSATLSLGIIRAGTPCFAGRWPWAAPPHRAGAVQGQFPDHGAVLEEQGILPWAAMIPTAMGRSKGPSFSGRRAGYGQPVVGEGTRCFGAARTVPGIPAPWRPGPPPRTWACRRTVHFHPYGKAVYPEGRSCGCGQHGAPLPSMDQKFNQLNQRRYWA